MYLGVDCGTQGTKVVIIDPQKKIVVADGYASHEFISDSNGKFEQEPGWWIEAFKSAYYQALSSGNFDPKNIDAIGISGQQHGLVILNEKGDVIRPAKLWCDTETATENAMLIESLGGNQGSIDAVGLVIATGYTASKLLWLKRHEPENFSSIAHILLPHDYLNYWFTGEFVMECGDASGTGFMDVRSKEWSDVVLDKIDDAGFLRQALPKIIRSDEPAGIIREDLAHELGLRSNVLLSSGGGDNMMGAIGTGNITGGIVTVSLGTSGTLYAYSDSQPILSHSSVAPFCSSNNGWLPLICTMNLTGTMNKFRELFSLNLDEMNHAISNAPIGSEGIIVLPFLNGERVPALPDASGSLHGINLQNFKSDNVMRAAMEAVTFGLRYGMDLLRESGIESTELRLVGGGAKSQLWRQMVADVMNTKVVYPDIVEAAALGGAIQAQWCHLISQGDSVTLADICESYIAVDSTQTILPISENVVAYEKVYQKYRLTLSNYFCNA